MPYRFQQVQEGYFHVYNRGNDKDEIFHNPQDYGYCLMPNHFHFLVEARGGSSISDFMKMTQMVLAKYLQENYNKVGHVFQGRFKAKEIKNQEQFLYLTAYIHTNPRVAGLVAKLNDWQWSSFLDYVGLRKGTLIKKDLVFEYFENPQKYGNWVEYIAEDKLSRKLGGLMLDGGE
ncbi:transposase [Patescibacteria group bacterium]|nr:transposase [Patescibacteria group bacterium]